MEKEEVSGRVEVLKIFDANRRSAMAAISGLCKTEKTHKNNLCLNPAEINIGFSSCLNRLIRVPIYYLMKNIGCKCGQVKIVVYNHINNRIELYHISAYLLYSPNLTK